MSDAHGILGVMSTSHVLGELPPSVLLPGQRDLPSDDGVPMETERHRGQMNLLIDSLEFATRDREDLYVSGNMFVYFSPAQVKSHDFRGPDVFVVLGTTKKERLSWVLWEEWCLPDVVIELTSDSTRENDRGPKKRIYERVWKTAVYVLYDPLSHELEGFRLDGGRYVPIVPDETGAIEVHVLGLRLGVRDVPVNGTCGPPALVWIDASGEPLPAGIHLLGRAEAETARADAEKARADAEKARADVEKTRADALAAELEALRRSR